MDAITFSFKMELSVLNISNEQTIAKNCVNTAFQRAPSAIESLSQALNVFKELCTHMSGAHNSVETKLVGDRL